MPWWVVGLVAWAAFLILFVGTMFIGRMVMDMHGDELFDRDDQFESVPKFAIVTPLEPEIQEIVDSIIYQRENWLSIQIAQAQRNGADTDVIVAYACDQMRRAGIPVKRGNLNPVSDMLEVDIALPKGVG